MHPTNRHMAGYPYQSPHQSPFPANMGLIPVLPPLGQVQPVFLGSALSPAPAVWPALHAPVLTVSVTVSSQSYSPQIPPHLNPLNYPPFPPPAYAPLPPHHQPGLMRAPPAPLTPWVTTSAARERVPPAPNTQCKTDVIQGQYCGVDFLQKGVGEYLVETKDRRSFCAADYPKCKKIVRLEDDSLTIEAYSSSLLSPLGIGKKKREGDAFSTTVVSKLREGFVYDVIGHGKDMSSYAFYDGKWKEGKPHGQGRLTFLDGGSWAPVNEGLGCWDEGKMCGLFRVSRGNETKEIYFVEGVSLEV